MIILAALEVVLRGEAEHAARRLSAAGDGSPRRARRGVSMASMRSRSSLDRRDALRLDAPSRSCRRSRSRRSSACAPRSAAVSSPRSRGSARSVCAIALRHFLEAAVARIDRRQRIGLPPAADRVLVEVVARRDGAIDLREREPVLPEERLRPRRRRRRRLRPRRRQTRTR